jgi:hypothetical protein
LKRWVAVLIVAVVGVFSFTLGTYASQDMIKIFINGKESTPDVPAQIIDGRTMVPLRFIAEALNAQVDWNGGSRSVFIWTAEWKEQNNVASHDINEFKSKAKELLALCREMYDFAGGDNDNIEKAKDNLAKLGLVQLQFRSISVADEYKNLKKLLLNASYELQEATEYQILYLQSNSSYNKLSYILKRNEHLKEFVNLLADCSAEVESL